MTIYGPAAKVSIVTLNIISGKLILTLHINFLSIFIFMEIWIS